VAAINSARLLPAVLAGRRDSSQAARDRNIPRVPDSQVPAVLVPQADVPDLARDPASEPRVQAALADHAPALEAHRQRVKRHVHSAQRRIAAVVEASSIQRQKKVR
jgi:hypothetical protein